MDDIRHALRMFGKNPGFALLAILTLGLGVGATTAMFSVVNGVLLVPLPYKDSANLMVLTERDVKHNQVQPYSLSYLNFQDWRASQHSFSDLALVRANSSFKAPTSTQPFISVRMVNWNFLALLGVRPLIGRDFTPDDDRPEAHPVIILSYPGWLKHFGPRSMANAKGLAAPMSLMGESIQFNDTTYDVIGILPKDFIFSTADFNAASDGFIPIGLSKDIWTTERFRRPGLAAIGRLRPGVTRQEGQNDLGAIAHQLEIAYPDANENRGAAVTPIMDTMITDDLRSTLSVFAAAVILVLLMAIANVTNLLLARATTRQKELAIRFALGGRWQVVRQLVVENVILAIAAAAAGVVIAIVSVDLLVLSAPVGLPRITNVGIDWRVLTFSLAVSILSSIAFSVAPIVQSLRSSILAELKEGGTSAVAGRHGLQKVIIVGEIALAMILLLGAGLMFRSTQKALSGDPGFDPKNLWSTGVSVSESDYKGAFARRRLMTELENRFRASGVNGAAIAIGGLPKPIAVSPAYLHVMGLRLAKGRFFDERDSASAPPTIVIDETLARARYRDEDPIGKPFVIDLPGIRTFQLDRPREVIGVVNRVQRLGIETDDETIIQSQFYLAVDQLPEELLEVIAPRLLIKTFLPENQVPGRFSATLHAIDPKLDAGGTLKMQDAVERALLPRRYVAKLFGVFAVVAFVLAAMGIFGLVSYFVSQRTQEIGIRMALGAAANDVVRMVVRQAAVLVTSGIVLGVMASFWLKRFVEYLLFNVSATDPLTYVAATILLLSVALAAAYLPAYRASRLEPMIALRGATSVSKSGSAIAGGSDSRKPTEEFVIEVIGLQKIYKTFRGKPAPALDEVSFKVAPGTIFGLIGQNGAGKTTLVKILMGLAHPTNGSARLLGCSPGNSVAKRRIGYLPENMKIPQHFGPVEFMRYMGKLNDIDPSVLEARIPALLTKVGLGGVSKPVKSFSKGMLQRLGLAQSLLNDPELLFLDEPTDGLDPLGRIFVRDLLVQLKDAGKTVFLNSHLLSEIELVCDRIVILDKGVVACETTAAEFSHGTGEYTIRIDAAQAQAEPLVERVVGPVFWTDNGFRCRPRDNEHLNELVDALRAARVRIVSIEPVRLSLEQFFIQVVTTEKES